MADMKGKVLLIVNTATGCGFTPQYEALEKLYEKYHDRGFEILDFPCNQFGHQDPGTDSEINSFCQINYGVSFQIMKKIDVNGNNADPIFKYLKKEAGGFLTDAIKWNFTKFLVSRDGKTIRRFSPITTPDKLEKDIEEMLG